MNRKILFILIVLISICAISHAYAAGDNETLTEGEILLTDDNIYQFDENEYTFADIKDKIESANDGDRFSFNGTFEFADEIKINRSISIEGIDEGATIKAEAFHVGNFRFFNVESSASNTILNNLKFVNGMDNNGGAVLWQADNGIISNCEFTKNIAPNTLGGALFLDGDGCNITNCTFTDNSARQGGAVFIRGNDNSLTSCHFDKNYADSSDSSTGGALFSNCNRLKIENCNFTNNYADIYGGAVVVNATGGNIIRSLFRNNHVDASNSTGGGAVYTAGQGMSVENCIFDKNSVLASNGGAIILGEFSTVKYSSFTNNTAVLGNDVYACSSSNVVANSFIIRFNETKNDAVYGISESDLDNFNNNFTVIKVDSRVEFSAGIIFDYGSTSSPVLVTVDGGSVSQDTMEVLNHSEAKISYSKNILKVSGLAVGKYVLRITTIPDENHYSTYKDINITVNRALAVIKASSTSVVLKKNTYWKISFINSKTGKAISGMKLTLKVYTGKKYKKVTVKTDSKGVASFKTSGLTKGKHKMVVSGSHPGYTFKSVTSYVTVVKPTPLYFKVDTLSNTKKGSLVSFKVINKKTKKGVNGVKVNFFVKVGKKYKKFITLKTKKVHRETGMVGIFTNEFSVGKHTILVKPVSIKYSGSKSVNINIKKSSKKYPSKTSNI